MKNLATDPHTPPVASTAAEPMNQAEERKAGSLLPQESPIIPGTAVPQSDSALAHDRTVISLRPVAAPSEFVRSLSLIDLARSLEGRQLHHFSVEQMIGGGGMGAVFRGRDLRLDREVAIKVIPESRRDAETLRRFRLEAQSAARLDHPNIARVYDIGEDESWNYIVFEYIEGINLRDLVQLEGPLSIDDAVYTTRQVAEALQHADDRGVVHRDIKPSNVIITPAGLAKVVDMGLARNTAMEQSSADQTASGVTLGTFDYISPEQARDPRDADVRSDLYSLGCTLFFMLSGQPPFPEGTALQKLLNHGSQPPPDPRQWRDDISDELFAVLAKMMAKRPADRYQKPLELINDLLLIAQKEGLARSRTAGNLLLRPSVARRSLLETNLPWLVSLCGLLAIAIWLQSSDSLTVPLELPKPTFEPRADRGPRGNPVEPSRVDSTPQSWAAPPRGSDEAEDIKQVSSLSSSRSDQPSSATNVAGTPSPGLLPEDQRPPAIGSSPPATANAGAGLSDENSLVRTQQANGPSSGPSSARSSLASRDPLFEMNGLPAAGMPANSTRGVVASAQPESPSSVPLPTTAPTEASGSLPEQPIALGREVATGSLSRLGGTDLPGGVQSGLGDRLVVSQRRPLGLEDSRWSDSLPGALAMAADNPEIRVIELRESIELNQAITWPRSGLTVCAAPDAIVEVILSGQWTSGMGWESWFDVQRWNVRFERIHFLCRNDMHQKQAMFLVQPGGELELFQCAATLQSNQDALLGSCIVVQEADRLRERNVIPTSPGLTASNPAIGAAVSPATAASSTSLPTSNDMDSEPVTITIRQSLIRGHQNMVSLRTVCRAEITLEKTCAILEGRGINLRATEQDRMPPVVRLNLDQSTLICRQGFAAIQTAYTMRAPITLTRTARMCAFWSPPTVPHITVDGLTSLEELELLLQLRGEDNAYDQNISTLCQCRLADGQHIDFSFRDAPGEWFRERGNDSLLRWQTAVPPEQPLEQQQADDYRLRGGMFVPGLPPDSLPPPLAPLAKH